MHLSLPKQFPLLFILASSVCKSLQYLTSALTQGGEDGHLVGLTHSIVLQGGRKIGNKCHWHVWGVLAVSGPHWICPCSQHVCFPNLHCSGSRLLTGELSMVGPGLHALPRAKPLRFGFSGTPQRHRLGQACVLCPSQVRAAQGLGAWRAHTPQVGGESYHLPHPSHSVSWVHSGSTVSGVLCLFWGADLWLRNSWQMSTIQDPRRLG